MWFDVLKINLATLQESLGDAQATNIDIKTDNKCKEKLQNFAKALESSGLHFDRKVNNIDEMDEELACIVVESIDKFWNSGLKDFSTIYGTGNVGGTKENEGNVFGLSTREEVNVKDMGYEIDIDARFSPVMDFTRIVIFDIDVMSWTKNNRGTVRFMSYKISTLDRNMTLERIREKGTAIKDFRNRAEIEYNKIFRLWRSS